MSKNMPSSKEPLLPLVPDPELDILSKENACSYTLRSTPTDANSPTYKVMTRILEGTESVRPVLQWATGVERVIRGLNISDINPMIAITETLLRGTALNLFQKSIQDLSEAAFTAALDTAADEPARIVIRGHGVDHYRHVDHWEPAIQNIVANLVPPKVLARVKRYLRRECRKPTDMKVRPYFQHLERINNEEIPKLPPFGVNQSLHPDEMIDVITYGCPRSWSREMDRQGFDPLTHTPGQVVGFMERIETAEDFDGNKVPTKDKSISGRIPKKKPSSSSTGKQTKYCTLHGKGNHSTEECMKLKADAKRHKSGNFSHGNGGKYGNKTWSRKQGDDSRNTSKKELHAFMKKAIKAGVQKELASVEKKRKADVDDDEFDLNAFDDDLKEFNYEDMSNLKIDSDDDSSK